MNKHTFLILRGTARAITYTFFAASILLAPALASLVLGGELSA